jgi:hypothetical protein
LRRIQIKKSPSLRLCAGRLKRIPSRSPCPARLPPASIPAMGKTYSTNPETSKRNCTRKLHRFRAGPIAGVFHGGAFTLFGSPRSGFHLLCNATPHRRFATTISVAGRRRIDAAARRRLSRRRKAGVQQGFVEIRDSCAGMTRRPAAIRSEKRGALVV